MEMLIQIALLSEIPYYITNLLSFTLFPIKNCLLLSSLAARDLIIRFIHPVHRVLKGQWNQKTLPLAIHYVS